MATQSFDPRKTFEDIKQNLERAVLELLSVESGHRILKVDSVILDNSKLSTTAFADQQKVKEVGGSYDFPVHANLRLLDKKSGKQLSKGRVLIGRLPMITQRLTYILGGREYQASQQFRRMSGVYTRISDRGDIEAVATSSRMGQMKMRLDPKTYQIIIQPVRGSSSQVSLYDLLSVAGKSDEEIGRAWGKEFVKKSREARSDQRRKTVVMNIAKKMVTRNDVDVNMVTAKDAAIFIFKKLGDYTLDPRVTQDVLGRAHTVLDQDTLIDAGKAIVNISKGLAQPSSYNNIGHKQFMSPGDLLRDYLSRDTREIQTKLINRMGPKSEDVKVVAGNVLTKRIGSFFRIGAEGLVAEADMTNPIATLSGHTLTTVKGMGGIGVGPGMQLGSAQQAHSSHIGFLDPVDTGESANTGLNLYMSLGATKEGDRLHSMMYSVKEKKVVKVDPLTADKSIVAYPEDIEYDGKTVRALKPKVRVAMPGGANGKVPLNKVDYVMLSAQHNFGLRANMVPFLGNNNGNRVMIGSKMIAQAVSLVDREVPLVQTLNERTLKTYDDEVGRVNSLVTPVSGTVKRIAPDHIVITSDEGKDIKIQKYNEYPTNDPKTMLHHEPIVEVGQSVKKGQVIADSNFTRNGKMALGTNLRVGYLPMRGYNYEDGVVISRSASEKLTSDHMYTYELDCAVQLGTKLTPKIIDAQEDNAVLIDKDFFRVMCARSARNYKNYDDLDEHGVVKKGTKIGKDFVLIAACRRVDNDPARANLMRTTRIKSAWRGCEEVWKKDSPGVVSKVIKTGKMVKIFIRSQEPMKIGDKLVGRYGNKGIITKILENHEMPYVGTDENGDRKHLEVAMHPAGVPGRINIGQLMELGASKIAEKTGKPYIVKNFDKTSKDKMRELIKEMKSHGLSDQDIAYDPKTDRQLGSIISGKQFIFKLTHQVDKKLTSRPGGMIPGVTGYKYDINNQPKSGAPTGGQALGALGLYSMLGHNARAFARDLQTHHSTYQVAERPGEYDSDEYWNALMQGLPLPSAKPTFAVDKFMSFLKAMGIDPRKNGDELQLVPMTDKDVLKNCPHEIKKPNRMVRGKDAKPEPGGLFSFPDGDVRSRSWGHIKLAERIINPVFEKPVAILLGVPVSKIGAYLNNPEQGGMKSVIAQLKALDTAKEIRKSKEAVKGARKTEKDLHYKRLKLLNNLKTLGMNPYDAYTMKYMPVLPPRMRPLMLSDSVGAQGDIDTVDINQLYKAVGIANGLVKDAPKEITPEDKNKLALLLYGKVKDAYIDGAMDNKGAPMNSLLQAAVQPKDQGGHKQGKEGFFQAKLIKRRADLSGRSVITPEPDLKLDQVGIPRKMALNIYRPFVIRELKTMGYSTLAAAKLYKDDPTDPSIREALERAIADRPCIIKRDPALHKHNIMAFHPKIVEGKSVQIHPLVCGGFNADFDGDTMGVWVPSSDEAREEAKNMLPSKNLFGAKGFQLMNKPEWGAAYGIWQLTELGKRKKLKIETPAQAYLLHKQGKLDIADVFSYKGKSTTVGRMMLFEKLPSVYKNAELGTKVMYGPELTKKKMGTILSQIAKERPDLYPNLVDDWKDLGNKYAHEKVWSFGLSDFLAHGDIRDKHIKAADARLAKLKNPTPADKVREYGKASVKIRKEVEDRLKKDGKNRAYRMTKQSGAMGSKYNQVEQLIISPLQVTNFDGSVVPDVVRKSYSEGLSLSDYWDSIPGVRAGTLSRVAGTSEPGAKAKDLINLNISTVVSEKDCGTTNGVPINTSDTDLESRYLVETIKAGSKVYKRNTLVGPDELKFIRKYHKTVNVRSPLGCKALNGVCKLCAGNTENAKTYEVGENAGILSAQSLSEPLTQMAMNAFHTGGSASGKGAEVGGHFERLALLFNAPQTVPDSAQIAPSEGRVDKIEKDKVAGGTLITVSGEVVRVPQNKEILVKVGQRVKAGQALSSGPVNLHELLEASGMPRVRQYMLEKMQDVYGGYGVRRRHVEMLLKNLTGIVQVVDDPIADHAPGDLLTAQQVRRINAERKEKNKETIKAKPKLLGINQAVRVATEGDFLAQMNYQHVRASLIDGMAHGAKSSLHGFNPIPGLVLGTTGHTESGKY